MATITITKKITKDEELVAIPRKEYEAYLQLSKIISVVKMTAKEKKEWKKAKKDYEKGKYLTLDELKNEMESSYKRKS